ncbi:MAG: GNAT family N-acetyltransferase, partial [Saprospiraceae bacterium]
YLNILYDIVRLGLETGCSTIVFARTALEIKSSIGATAHSLWCYVRHQNGLVNNFTATILDYLKPVEVWQPRHPFREEH